MIRRQKIILLSAAAKKFWNILRVWYFEQTTKNKYNKSVPWKQNRKKEESRSLENIFVWIVVLILKNIKIKKAKTLFLSSNTRKIVEKFIFLSFFVISRNGNIFSEFLIDLWEFFRQNVCEF